ncbi:glutathione hydrolase 7 isoform X7 [Oncorhynchus mykiss]|uniref:glutathione hydrolase 7 isoform X7 n=1 Tax=Oncorhynchus mykiss TaxID=8022 RepID=UPI001877DD43|nr:glutathione hydrolase 7 isoform X7 [Oncorhynchus mykiss]
MLTCRFASHQMGRERVVLCLSNCGSCAYLCVNIGKMDVSPETKLSSRQSPVGYKSFEGLPQLTVDDTLTKGQNFQNEHNRNTGLHGHGGLSSAPDLSSLPKELPLRHLASGSQHPNLADLSLSSFREMDKDLPPWGPSRCGTWQDAIIPIYAASLIIAIAVTTAMVLQIYLGTNEQVFRGSVLVTDHEHCTELGRRVLNEQGSSVDSAIVATLCLGIVHPHASGIGGGGVMLVHDIRKNIRKVINFQETAPSGIEEILQIDPELKPGLIVGVPGLLRGLYQAHKLYGRLSWEDIVTRAANVARDGFNVSHRLAEAITKVKGQNMSLRFRDMFLPRGHALSPGSLMKTPSLAAVLEAGVSEFYNGTLTQEMASEVQENGGILTKEDLSNYSAVISQPIEGLYQASSGLHNISWQHPPSGFRVLVPPPPSIGAALISALNILEDFHLNGNSTTNRANHWIAESLKASLTMASGLGDPAYTPSVSALLSKMQSSLNRPFGSRILTPSGILLNSQILDFSWPIRTQGLLISNLTNRVQPGKRPLSFIMPTIVIPSLGKCGSYVALGSSNGESSLSGVTQVLINILSYNKNLNDSISLGRLHPQLKPSRLLVDSEFLEEDVKVLRLKGHTVYRVGLLSLVQGAQKTNDIIRGIVDPRAVAGSA